MGQVDFRGQSHVFDYPTNRGDDRAVAEPVVRVDLGNRIEGHVVDGQTSAQPDDAIDIPGIKALLARPDVVLLPHFPSLADRP